MSQTFTAFVELGQNLVKAKGLDWEIPLDDAGSAKDGIGWNLTAAVGDVPPPNHYLRDLGSEKKALAIVNKQRAANNLAPLMRTSLSSAWQDFIKAAVADQLFFKRNATGYVIQSILRPLRVVASCTEKEPWMLQLDDLRFAINVARDMQASGKLADLVVGLVKVVFDQHHICDVGQIYPMLGLARIPVRSVKSKHTMSKEELRTNLEQRKRAERLPERRAFWELVRISMTEKPNTFMDELRFAAIRTIIITGLRVGEAALLPFDWKRERAYLDARGRPAGEAGGISSSLMLRHYAEKQQEEQSDSVVLRENTQPVPEMFREILTDSLDRVARLTQPLRKTLKLQCETGRILPWYNASDVIPLVELYPLVTGNPFWLDIDREPFIERYREDFNFDVLEELGRLQFERYKSQGGKLDMALYMFGNRLQKQIDSGEYALRFRSANGAPIAGGSRMNWRETYLCVGDLEEFIRRATPSKTPDLAPLPLETGTVQPWEFLFLHPKRSLAEERNDGLCDVTRYFSVNRPDPTFVALSLGGAKSLPSIFERYGQTDEDRTLKIEAHSLRHLQNTELFRLGVADTIISKRFNRRSVAQSYEYDHRSLAEELDEIEMPDELEILLGDKATTVAKMIATGRANGPIVDSFRQIQRRQGDAAAYEFLRAEADGFHATPYGHCLNSFTVDPCPKHLECFSGCRHLSATDLPENRHNLIRLEGKLKGAIETIKTRPSTSIGWQNQLEHAVKRLNGVQTLLATPAGRPVFPDGPDLSRGDLPGVLDD
jgi:hypothetical protein